MAGHSGGASGGVTLSNQNDHLIASVSTTSGTFVTCALSLTLANRAGGVALITAHADMRSNTLGEMNSMALFDDGTEITGTATDHEGAVSNQRHVLSCSFTMALDGSVITVRYKRSSGAGTVFIFGQVDAYSHFSILEIS